MTRIFSCRTLVATVAVLSNHVLSTGPAGAALTAADPSSICEQAAVAASQAEGVPLSVLTAISLNETGRKRGGAFRPWPWTVNMEGKGEWFETNDQALQFATDAFNGGARSFDIGCFQINYKWHGQHFASIEEMFDPLTNALYAARLLNDLYAEKGTWELAAGAYHSRTPEFAERYAARFARFRNGLIDGGGEDIPEIPDIVLAASGGGAAPDAAGRPAQINTYPLLQAGNGASLGSLVPISNGLGTGLFGPVSTAAASE